MTGAIIWLVIEVILLIMFWDQWPGNKGMFYRVFMAGAIGSQIFTIGHIYWKNYQANQLLRDTLQDAQDALDDSIRDRGDNTPYARYMQPGRMKPIDQVRYKEQLDKQRGE